MYSSPNFAISPSAPRSTRARLEDICGSAPSPSVGSAATAASARARDRRRVGADLLQDRDDHPFGLVEQGEQQVGGGDLGVAPGARQLLRRRHRFAAISR